MYQHTKKEVHRSRFQKLEIKQDIHTQACRQMWPNALPHSIHRW